MKAKFSDTLIEKEDPSDNRSDVNSGDVRFEFRLGYKLFSMGFIISFSSSKQAVGQYAKVGSNSFSHNVLNYYHHFHYHLILEAHIFSWHNSPSWARTSSLSRLKVHTHKNTYMQHCIVLLSTNDQPGAETFTWQQTTVKRERDMQAPDGIRTCNTSKWAAAGASVLAATVIVTVHLKKNCNFTDLLQECWQIAALLLEPVQVLGTWEPAILTYLEPQNALCQQLIRFALVSHPEIIF